MRKRAAPDEDQAQKTRRVRARKGGLATRTKYGREYFSRIGKLGGRPPKYAK